MFSGDSRYRSPARRIRLFAASAASVLLLVLPDLSPAEILLWPAQTEFEAKPELHFGGTRAVAPADVNGDQLPDLLVTATGAPGDDGVVAVLLGADDSTFDEATFYPVGTDPRAIAVGDLNGDRVPDVAVANGETDDVAVLLAAGGGTLGAANFMSTGPNPSSLAIGDLSGDSLPDLVVANSESDNVSVFLGVGNGAFGGARTFPAGLGPSAVAIGDLNGDQVLDVAVTDVEASVVSVLLGVGDGTLGPPRPFGAGQNPTSLAIGDLNGDQVLDLVVGNYSSSNIMVFLGAGDGTFGLPSSFGVSDNPMSLAIADFNLDSVPDVVVLTNLGKVDLLRGTGTGNLTRTNTYAVATFGSSLAAADMNGDQVTDVVFLDSYNVGVVFGLGDGTLAQHDQYALGGGSGPVVVGDLNGDHMLDVAVGSTSPFGNIATLLGRGDGGFEVGSFYGGDDFPVGLTAADLNHDQVLDLAFIGGTPDSLAVLLGVGDGTFQSGGSFVAGPDPTSLAIDDLNGDEDLDIIVTGEDRLAVLLGAGDGTFGTPDYLPAGRESSVAVGDLDGDDVPDLAVATLDTDSLQIRLGAGDGTFSPVADYRVGALPVFVVIAELNADQARDVVVVNGASADIAVLLGHGDGTFDSPEFYRAGYGPNAAVVTDMNGDQIPDIAVSNSSTDNVAILVGAGDGTFAPARLYGASAIPRSIGAGDFNGDGLPDLAVGSSPTSILFASRPPVITAPVTLEFPPVTVGDSVTVDLTIANAGLTRVPITHVACSSPEMRPAIALPITVEPGASLRLPLRLAPRERLETQGEVRVHTIVRPAISVQVTSDIHPLTVSSRREPADERVELGQELNVIVTPDPEVHVERGALHYSILNIGGQFTIPLTSTAEGFEATIPARHVTEDGLEYYIEVENSGVIALDPPNAPDSTYAVRVRFTSFPLPNAGERFLEGDPIQVVTNFTSIDSGTLYYRRTAERTYHAVPLDTQQPIPAATIPDSVVGPRGIEYWMEIVRGTDTQTDPPDWTGLWPRTIRVSSEALQEEHDSDGDGRYRMVSVPLDFGRNITLEALLSDQATFGPYDPLKWRSFRFAAAESAQRYVELSEDEFPEVHRVIPGRAFWLASKEPGRIETAPIAGTSTTNDDFYPVMVQPGWNQIGNPFLFPVAWDSMAVVLREEIFPMSEAVGVLEPPIAWRHQGYEDSVKSLDPFDGYWVKSLADTTITLLIPPREAPLGSGRMERVVADHEAGWAISMRASAAGAADRAVAGVSPDADSGWDAHDRLEPPMAPGESIALYFPHAEWEKRPGAYTTDIRGAFGPLAAERDVASLLPHAEAWGHAWRFDVAKSRARVEEVRLEFAGLEDVPKEADVFLLDRRLGIARDLRTDGRYAFYLGPQPAIASEESARFVLVVGSAEFRDAALGGLPAPPARTVLHPSHPNPFNPATLIRFDIASAGRVTLGIYDVRGALVKILTEGRREPGRYEITWNGTDQAGRRVASGVYFCRLTSEHFSEARKLIMLR